MLGVVFKLFVVEKQLFARREHEFGAAVITLENSVDKFHGRLPQSRKRRRIGRDLIACRSVSLSSIVLTPTRARTALLNEAAKYSGSEYQKLNPSLALAAQVCQHIFWKVCRDVPSEYPNWHNPLGEQA
jgi:hypothetical protein